MSQDKPTVLLVAGPGGMAFDEKQITLAAENFRKAGANVVVVGDGQKNITLAEIASAAEGIKGPMTAFVMTHGDVKGGRHCIGLTEECNTPTRDFFAAVTKARDGKKFDVFMASCHGGAAQMAANDILPKGSAFVDLAPGDQAVAGADVQKLIRTMMENTEIAGTMSGEKLLNEYLMKDLGNRISSSVTIAGQGTYNLEAVLQKKVGQKFTPEEKEKVHTALDTQFGKEKIDAVIHKIESTKVGWDVEAVDFGPSMAVAFAAYDRSKGGIQLPKEFVMPGMTLSADAGARPFEAGFGGNSFQQIRPFPNPQIGTLQRW